MLHVKLKERQVSVLGKILEGDNNLIQNINP